MRLGILFVLICNLVIAQPHTDQLHFKHFSINDGLSENSVNCVVKAKDGSVWIGTDEGLNHFDGHEFIIYRNKSSDSKSLSNNSIRTFEFDSLDNLWIGTSYGLNRYNQVTDDFQVFKDSSSANNYTDILFDYARHRIWIADVESGLKYFDLKTEQIFSIPLTGLNDSKPWKLIFDLDQNLIVGTLDRGIVRFVPERNEVKVIQANTNTQPSLSHNTVRALLLKDEILWIGTEGGGVNKFNLRTNTIQVFSTANKNLAHDVVWSLGVDDNNLLWVGTDGGGLIILDAQKETFVSYLHSQENPQSLSGNTLRTIYVDEESNVWLGTFNNGLDYYHQFSRNFHHYAESLKVSSLVENSKGVVLVGTDGTGMFEFDPSTNLLTPSKDVSCKKILTMHEDKGGGVWLGTYQEGLHYKRGSTYEVYTPENSAILDQTIWAIAEDAVGNIWMGTNNGACWFDRETRQFKNLKSLKDYRTVFSSELVRSVYVDKDGIVWLGSSSLLVGYNPLTGTYKRYSADATSKTTISSSIIVSIKGNGDYLWVGTFGGGLNIVNKNTDEVLVYDEESGLPNNTVFSIEEDASGNFWMSTNKGIVKFNQSENIYFSFSSEMGESNKNFYAGSSLKSNDGKLYFGGNNGFNQFDPSRVVSSTENIKASVVRILDQSNLTASRPLLLDDEGGIRLEYSTSRFLGFTISAFHYLSPKDEQYAYRLIGFDDDWREINAQRDIIFTNLNPGNYTLEIKAGVNNQWSKHITTLPIFIKSPWWMTIYFKGFLMLLGVMGIIFYNRYRLKKLQNRKEELERVVLEKSKEIQSQTDELMVQNEELTAQNEQIFQQANALELAQHNLSQVNSDLESTVEKRTEELRQAYKELDTFFYRSSHDFRRPLTTFMGLAEVAKISTKDPFVLDLFKKVDETARSLDKMIHKLQSISDLEWQQMMYKEIDLGSLIDDVLYLYREELNHKNVRATTDIKMTTMRTYPALLKIVLENLVENSIQFCRMQEPRVSVKSYQKNGSIIIEVEDNGQGIVADYQQKIFDMYFRASTNSKGNGLGLYITKKAITKLKGTIEFKSEFDAGSTFIIQLPVE